MLMKIIECLGAVALIISIFKVADSYKYWLLYSFASILYIITMIHLGSIPYSVMGAILLVTGVRNYIKGRKKC